MGPRADVEKDTHWKKDVDSSKNYIRRRKYLANEYENANLKWVQILRHTSPTPAPIVAENAKRTFTVGSSHFDNRSAPPRDWSSPFICSRSMVRMAAGVSQAWSRAASGCVRRSSPVRFLYVTKALLNNVWNLEDDVAADWLWDMSVKAECLRMSADIWVIDRQRGLHWRGVLWAQPCLQLLRVSVWEFSF